MPNDTFFSESGEQSQVKSTIVTKYFDGWAPVMMSSQDKNRPGEVPRIAYIDLFAGPGRYDDGTKSTPLLILEKAIRGERLRERLVTVFNDKDETKAQSLRREIDALAGIDMLKYRPEIHTREIGEDIAKMFANTRFVPTLFFVDPWGYKGLSLQLISSMIKDWGCDCIFFFNYRRINMGLNNPVVQEHMESLFGEQRAEELRTNLAQLTVERRELVIIEELCQALRELGPRYVLPFRFKDDNGTRTSHHLIFVSKGLKGYEIMKNVMAKESSSTEQGVASFEYNRVESRFGSGQQLLFELSRPLDQLGDMLLEEFAGQTLSMRQIYLRHNVDRPYISRNYKDVLMQLEAEGKITASTHRKNTFGDNVQVTFPQRGGSRQ